MTPLLLLDLDDTLFETRSIPRSSVAPIINRFRQLIEHSSPPGLADAIVADLWKIPFDQLARKYQLAPVIKSEMADAIHKTNFNFDIHPFDDFKQLRAIPFEKILITTGFQKLQWAKIHSLGIKSCFSEIHIDDVLDSRRIYKKGIFTNLLNKRPASDGQVFVIGDNPESELKAGRELGLHTIQVAKFGQSRSENADHFITDYQQLHPIIGLEFID